MATTNQHDMYAGSSETTEGKVFTVSGQDWDSIVSGLAGGDGSSADEPRSLQWELPK